MVLRQEPRSLGLSRLIVDRPGKHTAREGTASWQGTDGAKQVKQMRANSAVCAVGKSPG